MNHSLPAVPVAFLTAAFCLCPLTAQQPIDAAAGSPASAALSAPPPLPVPIASFGACGDGQLLYVYGGHCGKAHAHSRDNQRDDLLRYNASNPGQGWRTVGHGRPLQSVALILHRGLVYRIGGMEARNPADAPADMWSTDEVVAFDPTTGAWSPRPALPEARSSHDAVLVGDRIVVAGGWQLAGKESKWLDTAWSLDLADPLAVWQPLPAPPFRRRALALAANGDKVCALGGLDAQGDVSAAAYVLDLGGAQWRRIGDLPGDGFAVSACGLAGRVYASGRTGDLLQLEGDQWRTIDSLALPRFFHRLVPGPRGQLLAIGGASDVHLGTSELLATNADTMQVQSLLEAHHPARNRQAFAMLGDRLLIAGGNLGKRQHDFEPEHFCDAVVEVDLRTGLCAQRAAMPLPRQSSAAAVVGNEMLTIGGFAHSEGCARAQASVFAYDSARDTWRAAMALPAPRTQAGIAQVGEELWLLGGIDYVPERAGEAAFEYHLDVLRRRAGSEAFESAGVTMPRARRAFGCAVRGAELWCVGGMTRDFEPVSEVDVYDTRDNTWRRGPEPLAPRVSPTLVQLDGSLVLVGGSLVGNDGLAPSTSLEILAPGATGWTRQEVPLAPPILAALPWRGRLLLATKRGEVLQLTLVRLPRGSA